MLQANVSSVSITPPMGVEMSGYGFYLNRKCSGIKDDLLCKALVLNYGKTKVAIVANDLLGVDKELTATTRALIQKETGIPPEGIVLANSHTHSGPAIFFLRGCGEVDEGYRAMLPRLICGAVSIASKELQPVSVKVGKGELRNLSFNRVVKGGIIDPDVATVSFYKEDGSMLATLGSFSCHPVTMRSSNTKLTADYPGVAARVVESVFPNSKFLFLQGSCGDTNPILAHTDHIFDVGTLLAGEMLKSIATSQAMAAPTISARSEVIKLPLVLPDESVLKTTFAENREKLRSLSKTDRDWIMPRFLVSWAEEMLEKLQADPKTEMAVEFQVIRIGDIALACNPSELFAEFGLRIKANAKIPTINVGYANDFIGYVPDRGEFERKGYAAARVPQMCGNFSFTPDVGDIFAEEMVRVITRM